jgi:hypothetical protein
MASNKRLIGEDGFMARGTLGTEVVGNGTLTIAKGAWVQITAKAGSSEFGQLSVGDFFYAPSIVTPVAGDKWKVLTLSILADGVGWNLDLSADEIDVTVNQDTVKKYRRGKADANGNVNFLYIAGVTDAVGGLANKFFDICEIALDGTAVVNKRDVGSIYLVGYLNKGSETDLEDNVAIATIMRVEFFSFSLPSKMGEPGNMDVPFRLSGESNPVLYRITLS